MASNLLTNIDKELQLLRTTRSNFASLLDGFSLSELNNIPKGFSNNLIWNFGHLVVTQQLLCYKLSQNEMYIEQSLVDKYRKGTSPQESVGKEELDKLTKLAIELVDKLEEDYKKGLFSEYQEYPTSYGYTIHSINEAISFNNVHEGVHYGYALALRKSLISSDEA